MHTYFLGANTPNGFVSCYDELFRDKRIRKALILKGGPGCGKSTLMRAVGKTAAELGCETEELLCSSDPDSLDGIIIPAAGLALADGTAPHILEPPLCGCEANYLNLGTCYDSKQLSAQKERLFALKAKNSACYPFAASCFSAAAAADTALHSLAKPTGIDVITSALCQGAKKQPTRGCITHRFYHALTPRGAVSCTLSCKTVWTLKDNYGIAPQILLTAAECLCEAGLDVILGSQPLSPQKLSHLVIPAQSAAYVVVTEQFPYPYPTAGQYDLDSLCTQAFTTKEALHAQQLLLLREQAVREGLKFLKEAKTYHDELEAVFKPAVNFDAVSKKTDEVKHLLLQMLCKE